MFFNHILWLNTEPNNCVLIQWPSPCLAQVGTLNAITLKSSIKENGFHTFVGEFIFPKKVCIWGRKETCLFWKLDTFPGQGRYSSSSTYVTKNSQALERRTLGYYLPTIGEVVAQRQDMTVSPGLPRDDEKLLGSASQTVWNAHFLARLETQARACVSL